jgi:hypothetical protein
MVDCCYPVEVRSPKSVGTLEENLKDSQMQSLDLAHSRFTYVEVDLGVFDMSLASCTTSQSRSEDDNTETGSERGSVNSAIRSERASGDNKMRSFDDAGGPSAIAEGGLDPFDGNSNSDPSTMNLEGWSEDDYGLDGESELDVRAMKYQKWYV